MKTESIVADDGRSLNPVALFCWRVAATAVLVAGNAWVVFEYSKFQEAQCMDYGLVVGGKDPRPTFLLVVEDCGVWPVVISSAAVVAAIVYIWGFARRVGSIILATLGAGSLCTIAAVSMQIATIEARKFNEDYTNAVLNARAASRP